MGNLHASSPFVDGPTVFEQAMHRTMAEFREMPGLQLTAPQAARLFAIDSQLCNAVLETLVEARFLERTRDALFVRAR